MIYKRAPHIHPKHMPLDWFTRWAAYCVVGIGYILGFFLELRSPLSLLLLTGVYVSWLLIFHNGRQRSHPFWWVALFCVACASLLIPLPSRDDIYWLPILPTTTACLLMARRPRVLALIAAAALCVGTSLAITLIFQQWDLGGQMILLISFGATCGCTATISELEAAHAQLQEYSEQVEELSAIRERNRIAREIHDTLGHGLTLLAVQLETATQLEARGDPRLREELRLARQVAKSCLTDVRHSVEALRPDETAHGSLQEQLRRLVAEFEATSHQTQISLDLEEATHPLHPELSLALYRCAQEALTNIRKHAQATRVLLLLSTSGGTGNQVELTVLDDGRGSTSHHEQETSGFGLRSMSERVALLGGTLRAGPDPGHGWRVEVVIPRTMLEEGKAIRAHTTRGKG